MASESATSNPYAPPGAPTPSPPAAPPPDSGNSAVADASRIGWVGSTYFAEGLPYSIVHQVVGQQYLTAVGADPIVLGLASFYHLPWLFKFLWSPLVDRFSSAKRWLVALELLLAALTLSLAVPAMLGHVAQVAWLLIPLAIVAATHDIAIDTYYMRALPRGRQDALSGLRIAAYRGALYFGSGLLVTLAGIFGFPFAFGLGALTLAILSLVHGFLLRPDQERPAKRPVGFEEVTAFFQKPGIGVALPFLLTFRLGDAFMFSMSSKLLSSLGLDTTMRGVVSGGIGTTASIVGAVLGGLVVAKAGLERVIRPIAAIQSVAILLYVVLAAVRLPLSGIAALVAAEQLVAGLGTAAFTVFILRLASGPYKATHFALGTALMSFGLLLSSVSGFVLNAVGFTQFFVFAFAASLPGVVLAMFLPRVIATWSRTTATTPAR